MTSKQHLAFLTLLLWLVCFITTRWLDKPFVGHHDWDNVLLTLEVQNYWEHGYWEHRGMQLRNFSFVEGPPDYYRSTPPTYAIAVSLLMRLWGLTEATFRLPNIFLTLVLIAFLYRLVRYLSGEAIALLTVFLFATMPFTLYFATITNWEVGTLLIMVLLTWAYGRWLRRGQWRDGLLLAGLAWLGVWFFYSIPWLLLLLFGHSLVWSTRRTQALMLGVGLVGLVGFISWGFYTTDGFDAAVIQEQRDHLRYRASVDAADAQEIAAGSPQQVTLVAYTQLFLIRLAHGFSIFVVGLALVGVYHSLRRPTTESTLPLVLFLSTLIHTSLWSNATYIHDFFMYAFAAPLAWWGGIGVRALWGDNRTLWAVNTHQRLVVGALWGHLLIMIFIVRFFAQFSNDLILWFADHAQTRTLPHEVVATDLPYSGPHDMFYAERLILYGIPATPEQLQAYLGEGDVNLFIACQTPPDDWPAQAQVESIEPCYAITWKE